MNLRDAAEEYLERGWIPLALGLDANGKPKRPLTPGWQSTSRAAVWGQPWGDAKGIGILLGPASGNLGVIDMDDSEFAAAVKDQFDRAGREVYWVTTGRNNGHLYVVEAVPTSPKTTRVEWRGRSFSLELKSRGQQVAAPPTTGYSHTGSDEPTTVPTLERAWESIARRMGIEVTRKATSAYPRAWKDSVSEGDRNKAIYVESCRLREAGMPIQSAIQTMRARVAAAFENGVGLSDSEIVRTVRSAYRERPKAGWVRL